MSKVSPIACGACGERLPPPAKRGRPRRFCNDTCRKQAARARGSGDGWAAAGDELEEIVPADPLTVQRQTFDAVAAMLDGEAAGAPEDQLARALIEQRTLAWRFRRLEPELPPQLAHRAASFADHVSAGISRWWPEVIE